MTISELETDYISDLVTTRTGNIVSSDQIDFIESRLAIVKREVGIENVEALISELRSSSTSSLHDRVAEVMMVKETRFFRDPVQFDAIGDYVIPEFITTRRRERVLRIWCAACSSGEEAFSIAIMLRARFPELGRWDIKITATDYSSEMLSKAASGTYSRADVNRGIPAMMLINKFSRVKLNWVIAPELRDQIEFRQQNLMEPFEVSEEFDLVLLRNVLTYFDRDNQSHILNRVRNSMRSDGYLFLGAGETMRDIPAPFTLDLVGSAIGYQPD